MQPQATLFSHDLERFGFSANRTGGHMSRSMMLTEIRQLQQTLPLDASQDDFRSAIEKRNVLAKPTQSSRHGSYRHLVELDVQKPLFRAFRRLAKEQPADLPLLAMLCVYGRDPQLRHSFKMIDTLSPGRCCHGKRWKSTLRKVSLGSSAMP
jgi:hypothetical protein